MRHAIVGFFLAVTMAEFAAGSDGEVSRATLFRLGLGGMELLTDADGAQIRGEGIASSWGRSLVTGVLIDPVSSSYVTGTDTNGARSIEKRKGKAVQAAHAQNSAINLSLSVTSNGFYFGKLAAGAGGRGWASGK
jgi:hypothetical protein